MRRIRLFFEGHDDIDFFKKTFPGFDAYFQSTYERSFNRGLMKYSERISGITSSEPAIEDSLDIIYRGKGGIREVFRKCSNDPYSVGIVDFDDGYLHTKVDGVYKSYSLLKNGSGYEYDVDFNKPKIVYSEARDLESTIIKENQSILSEMIRYCSSQSLSFTKIKQYEDQIIDILFKLDLVRKIEQDPSFKRDFTSIVRPISDKALIHFFSYSGKINADGHLEISQCFGSSNSFSVRKWVRCSLNRIKDEIGKTPSECEDALVSRVYENYGRGDKYIIPAVISKKYSKASGFSINKSKVFRNVDGWEEPLIFDFIRGHDIQPVMKAVMGDDYCERDDFTTTMVSKCKEKSLAGSDFENRLRDKMASIMDADLEDYYKSLHLSGMVYDK